MKRHNYLTYIVILLALCVSPPSEAQPRQVSVTLDDAMARARSVSVDAAVALNRLRSAYWEYRTFRADLLPEIIFNATVPGYFKQYSPYQESNGSYSFVRNNYLEMRGEISITQNIWLTGGRLSLNTSSTISVSSTAKSPTVSCRCRWR